MYTTQEVSKVHSTKFQAWECSMGGGIAVRSWWNFDVPTVTALRRQRENQSAVYIPSELYHHFSSHAGALCGYCRNTKILSTSHRNSASHTAFPRLKLRRSNLRDLLRRTHERAWCFTWSLSTRGRTDFRLKLSSITSARDDDLIGFKALKTSWLDCAELGDFAHMRKSYMPGRIRCATASKCSSQQRPPLHNQISHTSQR